MKRRKFIQIASITSLSLLATGCKSFAGKPRALLQVDQYINTEQKSVLKVPKNVFNVKSFVAIAYKNDAIGITKQNDEFFASLLVCTHLGCGVEFNTKSLDDNSLSGKEKSENAPPDYVCPCHGARFSSKGERLSGPATKNLTTYLTSNDDNFVYVYL